MEDSNKNNNKPAWKELFERIVYQVPDWVFGGEDDYTVEDALRSLWGELSEWEWEGNKRDFFNLPHSELKKLSLDSDLYPELTLYLQTVELIKEYGLSDYTPCYDFLREEDPNPAKESKALEQDIEEITKSILSSINNLISNRLEELQEEGKEAKLDPNLANEYLEDLIDMTTHEDLIPRLLKYGKQRILLANQGKKIIK